MNETVKRGLFALHLDGLVRDGANIIRRRTRFLIKEPPYGEDIRRMIDDTIDPIRFASIALAVTTVARSRIQGSIGEVGVYRGETSQLLHALAPDRKLYLFDTFEGFPVPDLEVDRDDRFRDTSVELVAKRLGDLANVDIRKGYFPETATGLENEKFAIVIIDVDLYKATLSALEFIYPRMSSGGYVFLHDLNCSESNWAASRAANEFMSDKAEKLIELPDTYGSAVFRRI